MSEVSDNDSSNNVSFIPSNRTSINHNKQHSIHFANSEEGLPDKIINNSVFRMMLRDLVYELVQDKRMQQEELKKEEPKQSVDSVIEFISQSLALVTESQTQKKIMEVEKYYGQVYETKMKELEERFERVVDEKVRQLQKKIAQIEEISEKIRYENIPKSPRGNSSIILKDFNISDQMTKRLELKQKILNYSTPLEYRNPNNNTESLSSLSDNNDGNVEKLNERVKKMEDNIKKQMEQLKQKMLLSQRKARQQLKSQVEYIKEENSLHFQSIWKVITQVQRSHFD